MIPMLAHALERSESLAMVMESRGFEDGERRLLAFKVPLRARDIVFAVGLNVAIVAALVQRLVDAGMAHPPVFYSANLDGGDELNRKLVDEYRESIRYEF